MARHGFFHTVEVKTGYTNLEEEAQDAVLTALRDGDVSVEDDDGNVIDWDDVEGWDIELLNIPSYIEAEVRFEIDREVQRFATVTVRIPVGPTTTEGYVRDAVANGLRTVGDGEVKVGRVTFDEETVEE